MAITVAKNHLNSSSYVIGLSTEEIDMLRAILRKASNKTDFDWEERNIADDFSTIINNALVLNGK